jgi:hypothetical protein
VQKPWIQSYKISVYGFGFAGSADCSELQKALGDYLPLLLGLTFTGNVCVYVCVCVCGTTTSKLQNSSNFAATQQQQYVAQLLCSFLGIS